jgi:hypothetical protein
MHAKRETGLKPKVACNYDLKAANKYCCELDTKLTSAAIVTIHSMNKKKKTSYINSHWI